MKITREQFNKASNAAFDYANSGGEALLTDGAIIEALAALGIHVEPTDPDIMVWVLRTWVDVREGDIIRPPGQTDETHAAIVEKIGPVNHWHAAPNASQYRPNESPMEWSAMRVTLADLNADRSFTPEYGMRPDAGVEIKVTREELAAIEACGGWSNRVRVLESNE